MVFFAFLLSHALRGVGQYWDWVFPYFPDQMSNFFERGAEAWTRDANGSPLGYSTDYLLRFVISLPHFLPPEWVLYALLVGVFTAGAYVVYLIGRRHTKAGLAFLLGLVAFVNPVIFYNFTAGYVDYLVAYAAFIYLAYFLLYRFRPELRSAAIVGLLITVVGIQIQLFAVAGVLLALFFIFRPEDLRLKYVPAMLGLPVLVGMVWLSNFLFGGANLGDISGQAAKATFKGLADSNYLNIFGFSFAKATLISRFYSSYELLLYSLFFTLIVILLLRARRKTVDDVFLLSFMLLMLFLATGLFQLVNLGPLTTLYPMFREVGHFAPLIVVALIILMARLMTKGMAMRLLVGIWLLLIIAISFVKFQTHTQSVSFAGVRQQFAEFKAFGDAHKDADHRVLGYPFFDQYAFVKFPISFQDNLPMRNSGHDSYAAFAGEQFVKNALKPDEIKGSAQYRLLQTMDVDVLQPYNVKYIYDFSNIYESYYDRYVPPASYDNDISLIKNNPYFLQDLMANNPGKLRQVSPHILEILDYAPRVAAADTAYAVDSIDAGEQSREFMAQTAPQTSFNYASFPAGSDIPHSSVAPLFADAGNPGLLNMAQKSLQQAVTLPPGNKTVLYSNVIPRNLSYKIVDKTLTFYASSSGKLYANGHVLQDYDADQTKTLGSLNMTSGYTYYASLNGSIVPLNNPAGARIGTVTGASTLEVFASNNQNIIQNPSFENGTSWTSAVNDCNAYDDKPDIAMSIDTTTATDGAKSLELSARRHDACTSIDFSLKPDATYLLGYDYKGQNTQSAAFYLRFNNSDQDAVKSFQSISDSDWHSMSQLVTTPDGTQHGDLTLHALASDAAEPAITHYDNVRVTPLQEIGSLDIPEPQAKYVTQDIANTGTVNFSYSDDSFDYQNVIKNPSFEQGLWQSSVTDCNNYDHSGNIAAKISTNAKTDGRQSLQLEATKHTACEYVNATVQSDTDYLLTFDYQGDPAQQAGYYLEYTDAGSGTQDQVTVVDRSWHTLTARVHIPATVTDVRLYLHAYESNGVTRNIVRFDNVKLIAIPTTQQQFYVVSQPSTPLRKPKSTTFKTIDDTHRSIRITGATQPFIVSLSESFHPQWRLELDNARVQGANSWLPGASADVAGEHFELNGYSNAWYIDPGKLCAQQKTGCTKNADGSYNLSLLAEFVPQRWFVINQFVSVGTLLAAAGYVAATHRRAKRAYESEGTYQHPLARRRRKT